jgi:HSP20 family protein
MSSKSISEKTGAKPRFAEHPLQVLRSEMDDLLSRFVSSGEDGWFVGKLSPQLDLSETDNAVEVRMDVPGVHAKELDIRISGNILTVSGERKEEKEEKGRTFYRSERKSGSFSRSVTLPCAVDESKVEAKCRDGVLTIALPKAAEARTKKIEVKA